MSNTNSLGELAFTEDEFDIRWPDGAPMMSSKQERAFVEAANRILAEKLARAPEIWLCDGELKTAHRAHPVDATSVGRLVCVTELIQLSEKDSKLMADALANPPEPNEALSKLKK